MVEIKFDKAKLKRIQKILADTPRAMPRIVSSAINKTTALAKTDISKRIRTVLAAKAAAVKKKISRKKATYRRWRSDLYISKKRLPLITFSARQNKAGVSYKIEKAGGRTTAPHTFIQTMPSGHEGVFVRKGKSRYPIAEKMGPSIGFVFETGGMVSQAKAEANKTLEKQIDSQIARILNKK